MCRSGNRRPEWRRSDSGGNPGPSAAARAAARPVPRCRDYGQHHHRGMAGRAQDRQHLVRAGMIKAGFYPQQRPHLQRGALDHGPGFLRALRRRTQDLFRLMAAACHPVAQFARRTAATIVQRAVVIAESRIVPCRFCMAGEDQSSMSKWGHGWNCLICHSDCWRSLPQPKLIGQARLTRQPPVMQSRPWGWSRKSWQRAVM